MTTASVTDALPQAPNHASRFAFLDVARGIAAMAVMLQHTMEAGGIESLAPGAVATTWLNLGETGVAIFFLVSGFIIPASMRGTPTIGRFWVRRVFRIYPLYWVVFALTLGLAVFLHHEPVPPMAATLASHLVLIQPWIGLKNYVGGSWTLLIEFVWYAAFSVAFFSVFGAGVRLVLTFLAAYLAVVVLASFLYPAFPFGRFSNFAFCFLGYLYLLRFEGKVARKPFLWIAAGFLTLIAASVVVGFLYNPSRAAGDPSFTCVAVSWSIALLFFPWLLARRDSGFANAPVLRFLGEISYSLYLLHSPIMFTLKTFGVTGPLLVLATFVVTILASMLTFRFIERPGIALARRLTKTASRRETDTRLTNSNDLSVNAGAP